MATFYGQVEGSAETNASRRGTYESHIAASVQSYDGSLTMELFYREREDGKGYDKHPWVQVYHHDGTSIYGNTIFRGSMERFVDMCKKEMES